ncbi:MAG TPA: RodZ domain-containing protein [Nocardioidaceae bacterium]
MPFDHSEHRDAHDESGSLEETAVAGTPVVVRRSAAVAALVGAAASSVAIAYLWRASQSAAALDWTLFGVMAVIAGYYLASLVDARTPLLVADDLGVRIRLGNEWRGLPWEAVGQVVVHPRRGMLRDGRIVFVPRSLARALDGLDAKGRRHAAMNQKMYGAALAVPVGTTTRVSGAGEGGVVDELSALTLGRAEVVELDPATLEVVDRSAAVTALASPDAASPDSRVVEGPTAPGLEGPTPPGQEGPESSTRTAAASEAVSPRGGTVQVDDRGPAPEPEATEDGAAAEEAGPAEDGAGEPDAPARAPRRSILGGIGTIVSRVAKGRSHDVDGPQPVVPASAPTGTSSEPGMPAASRVPLAPAAALRETRPGMRAEATINLPTAGTAALDPALAEDGARAAMPEGRELRRPGSVDLVFEPVPADDRVRPISTLGDPVEPLVIDDYVTEPAYDPVIGPELTAARTRLGMSVDDLAERTRIRPHVIESIEVDDFAPCGGDFYARGHLRTLARILGKDPEPLLKAFEERYATAPVNARRVFEAELATGMTGSMRSTVGGPNWGLLVGVVISLVLVWGVVRLFATEPAELVEMPAPVLNGSAGVAGGYPADAPAVPEAAAKPVTLRLTASQADTTVVVRDGDGMVVFSGEMVLGERKTLEVAPPVRVRAADGGAVEVRVEGRDRGLLGEAGEPARRTFRR